MNIISIKCPNCGGVIEREDGAHFAGCPYCGSEICFDEIREEAQVDAFREKLEVLERNDNFEESNRRRLRGWVKKRNIVFAVLAVLHLAGFTLAGFGSELDAEAPLGTGAVLVLLAWCMILFVLPILGAAYPEYNILSGKVEKGAKIIMWLKLAGVAVMVCIFTSFLAYLIVMSCLGTL